MTSRVVPAIGVTIERRVPRQPVEQRGLTDIRSADQHDLTRAARHVASILLAYKGLRHEAPKCTGCR